MLNSVPACHNCDIQNKLAQNWVKKTKFHVFSICRSNNFITWPLKWQKMLELLYKQMNVGPSANQIATYIVYFARMRSRAGGQTRARIRHVRRGLKVISPNEGTLVSEFQA